MMDSILWDNATRDYQAEQHTAQLERARVALAETVPFIVKATSHDEYLDRIALMQDKIETTLRGLASDEAEYVGLFGAVMSSLDEDFNTLREVRRTAAEDEPKAEMQDDEDDAEDASDDAEEASEEGEEASEEGDEAEGEEEAEEKSEDDEADDDEGEPEAAEKEARRRRASRKVAKTYDLGFGELGNGTTVWNRAEERDGDYVTVAHISDDGTVKYYEDVPADVKKRIENFASSERSASRKTAMNFDDAFPAGHVASNLFDSNGDPIVFHTQTYQILGSPGSRYHVIGLQTRQHSMSMMGDDARLVLSEDGRTPSRTSGGMIGGQFGVIPVPSATASRRKRALRKASAFVPVSQVRVGDEIDVTPIADDDLGGDAYFTVTKVQRADDLVYIYVDATNPASEDEDVFFVARPDTEVEVVSDHLASRKRATRKTAGWKKIDDTEWHFKYRDWTALIYKHNGKFFWEFTDPKDSYYDPEEDAPLVGGEASSFRDALIAVEERMYGHALATGKNSYIEQFAYPFEDVMNDRVRYLSSRKRGSRKTARKPVKGLAIYPDKRVEEVTLSGLSDYQSIVGGLIQPVTLSDGSTMYVNEEGLYVFGPDDFNSIATDVAGLGGASHILMSGLLGPAVLVGPVSNDGYDTDVTAAARAWVNRVAREASLKRRSLRRRTASQTLTTEELAPGMMIDLKGLSLYDDVDPFASTVFEDSLAEILSKTQVSPSEWELHVMTDEGDHLVWLAAGEEIKVVGSRQASRRRTAANKVYEVTVGGYESYSDEETEEIDYDSYVTDTFYVSAPSAEEARIAAEDWADGGGMIEPTSESAEEVEDPSSVSIDVTAGYKPKKPKPKPKKQARRRTAVSTEEAQNNASRALHNLVRAQEELRQAKEEHKVGDVHYWENELRNAQYAFDDAMDYIRSRSARRRTASVKSAALVSLTNVGIDRATGNGVGTDPSGNRVQFKITDEEREQLKFVLYSDLATNFSGVDVEESDIIRNASHRRALKRRAAWSWPPAADSNYDYSEYERGQADGWDDGYASGMKQPGAADRRYDWQMEPTSDYQQGYQDAWGEGFRSGSDERTGYGSPVAPGWFDPTYAGERWDEDY